MTKIVSLILLAALPAAMLAQEPVTKIIRVRYARPEALAHMIGIPDLQVRSDDSIRAIVLRGKPADVASAENTINDLDVPFAMNTHKDVELTVYILNANSSTEGAPPEPLPEAMGPVVKQLRTIFPYKNYQVASMVLLRSGETFSASSTGILQGFSKPSDTVPPDTFNMQYQRVDVISEQGKPTIHLRDFRFFSQVVSTDLKPEAHRQNIGISTDVDLREGQKVVVGKADVPSTGTALFVVLTARLVD